MKDINEILIGACDVYMYEFTGAEVPENTVIETDEHNVGHCSSGFTVDYKPTKYDVKNQYGQIVKSAVTEEAISAKTGILTWNLANMSLLSTGEYTEDREGSCVLCTSLRPRDKRQSRMTYYPCQTLH